MNFTDLLSIFASIDLTAVNSAFLSSRESPKEKMLRIVSLRALWVTTWVNALTYACGVECTFHLSGELGREWAKRSRAETISIGKERCSRAKS